MLVKGDVIMKNINLQKQVTLSYSHVIYNSNKVNEPVNYNKLLQNRLTIFSNMIKQAYPNILDSFIEYMKKSQISYTEDILFLLAELIGDYKKVEKKGLPVLDNMINIINGKKIDKETFEMLMSIMEYQEDITKDVLNREINLDRIEIVLNHLRDVSLHLKSDLELNTLSELKSTQININYRPTNNNMKLVEANYNPFIKEIA